MSKPLLRALKGETLSTPPFWFMRQAGRYLPEYRKIRKQSKNFLDFCYTPDLAVEVTLQPLRRYGMDGAILFSDILVVPDALGQKVEFIEGQGPVLEALDGMESLRKLSRDGLHGHLAPVYETVRTLAREIPDTTTLIGFAGAPWTVAVYMVQGRGGTDCEKIKSWATNAPDEFEQLIELLVDATADYLLEQVKNGAQVLQLFDSWAGLLEGGQFRRWIIEPNRAIVRKVHESAPDIPVIGFPRKVGDRYEEFVTETGVQGISLDSDVSVDWAARTLQKKCTVQGNLDNQLLIEGGPALDDGVKKILTALSGGPFIFNLGHGILPQTSPGNVGRVADTIKAWGG